MIYLKGLKEQILRMAMATTQNHWRGKEIIPISEWIQLRGTPYALQYFPDDFDEVWTQ
jgi:hypothetical protein